MKIKSKYSHKTNFGHLPTAISVHISKGCNKIKLISFTEASPYAKPFQPAKLYQGPEQIGPDGNRIYPQQYQQQQQQQQGYAQQQQFNQQQQQRFGHQQQFGQQYPFDQSQPFAPNQFVPGQLSPNQYPFDQSQQFAPNQLAPGQLSPHQYEMYQQKPNIVHQQWFEQRFKQPRTFVQAHPFQEHQPPYAPQQYGQFQQFSPQQYGPQQPQQFGYPYDQPQYYDQQQPQYMQPQQFGPQEGYGQPQQFGQMQQFQQAQPYQHPQHPQQYQQHQQPQHPQQYQQPQQYGQPQYPGQQQQMPTHHHQQQHVQFNRNVQQTYLDVPKGDETLPWRQSKSLKIRSRSLQPVTSNIEKLPWLRSAQRDHSVPKQPTFMQMFRDRVPMRPWIEEVIKLKRTELHQKVIERAKLEKVQLKESHIERKEIPHEELEKVDLKHLTWDAESSKHGQLNQLAEWQQALLSESMWSKHNITQEDKLSILELTQQIDDMIHADKSQAVPWEVHMQQLKTIEKTQKLIDKFKVEDVNLKSMREQAIQDHQRKISTHQRQQMEQQQLYEQMLLQQQQQQFVQPLSHTEDTLILKRAEHTKLDIRDIEQMNQETPHTWPRGMKQQQSDQGALSHVEDSTVLKLQKKEQITQKYTDLSDNAVGWRRGPRPQEGVSSDSQIELQHIQDENVIEQEEQSMPWMRGKKITKATMSQVEDTTHLQIDEREEIQQQQLDETPVMWQRGMKRPETVTHQEDIITQTIKTREVEEVQEKPVLWPRGKKVSKGVAAHVEDTTVLELDEHQQVDQKLLETPVMWKRGPKPQPAEMQPTEMQPAEEEQPTEEVVLVRKPIIPQQPAVKPWTEEQVKLKPPRKTTDEVDQKRAESLPKQVDEKARPWTEEQVTLKTARRESIEIEKLKPAKDEVQLKSIKPTKPQVDESISEKPKVIN